MRKSRIECRRVAVLFLVGVWFFAGSTRGMQMDPGDWSDLSTEAFVVEVRDVLRSSSATPTLREAAATEAASRLVALGTDGQLDYADFLWLYGWAQQKLTAAQKAALASRAAVPVRDIPTWDIKTLRQTAWAQFATDVSPDDGDVLLTTWLSAKTDKSAYSADTRNTAWLITRIKELQNRKESTAEIPAASLSALRQYVGELLAQEGAISGASYKDAIVLYEWSQNEVSVQSKAALRTRISAPNMSSAEITTWKLQDLRLADNSLATTDVSQQTRDAVISQWLAAHSEVFESLSGHGQVAWLAGRVRTLGLFSNDFEVTWKGKLTVPANGDYTFSIPPMDTNLDYTDEQIRQSVTVTLGGKTLLDARKDSWQHESKPVSLGAAEPAVLEMKLEYTDSSNGDQRLRGIGALLMWQSAGRSQVVVPSSAFSPLSGTGVGVEVTYRIRVGQNEEVITRMEPAINRVWLPADAVIGSEEAAGASLAANLLGQLSRETFLAIADQSLQGVGDTLEQRKVKLTLDVAQQVFLGSPLQADYTSLLLSRPSLLYGVSKPAELYRRARFASPATALELFGTWAQLHADLAPEISLDFYDQYRRQLRWAAQMMTWQYPDQYQVLAEQYLTQSDGSCCLPVAYVLAYAHFSLRKIETWIERLDAILEGQELSGDVRVNWLIARAQAEEIRRGIPGRHSQTHERLLAGRGYLEEAVLVATSQETKLRVLGELVARLGAEERLENAQALIEQARSMVTGPEAAATFTRWEAALETLKAEISQRREQREQLAQQAYIDRLRQRYQKAVAAEDPSGISRYRTLLLEAGADVK